MLPDDSPAKQVASKLSKHIPAFTDVFDEETFYIVAIIVFFVAALGCILASRFVTIKDLGHID